MQRANKVVFNMSILYGKMLITMFITLYSTRFILNGLGASDYGIYYLVAGIITMLSFLNSAMTASTQRFLSFYQGKKDWLMQKRIFHASLVLHIAIASLIVILLEIGGLFLFDHFLNIPAARVDVAKVIFHFMSFSVFFTIVAVPFTASINAHENIFWIAVVSIFETIAKFVIAFSLTYVSSDKLIFYGSSVAFISAISFSLYLFFCLKNYPECSLHGLEFPNKKTVEELTSFAGWNLFGSLCAVGRSQGTAVLLNLFFGTVVNAAYGISGQIAGQLNFFSSTMLRAINPQIMKSEGADDRRRMLRLAMIASKFGFFLLAIAAIPIIFEMQAILTLWLKKVPENSIMFCSLIIISSLIVQLTVGLQSAAQATGKIKYYQIVVGTVLLLNIPTSYVFLKLGFPAYIVMTVTISLDFTACLFRLYFLKRLAGLSIREYTEKVFLRELVPVLVSIMVCLLITNFVNIQYRFLLTGITSASFFILAVYFTGLCSDEKKLLHAMLDKAYNTIRSRRRVQVQNIKS